MRFLFLFSVLLLVAFAATSQSLPTNPLSVRFVKSWRLDRVQTRDGMQTQPSMIEFRMVVESNGSLTQGLYPEGMFESTWQWDGLRLTVRMTDLQSSVTYSLRVLQLTNDRMILEAIENGERTLMYYLPLR